MLRKLLTQRGTNTLSHFGLEDAHCLPFLKCYFCGFASSTYRQDFFVKCLVSCRRTYRTGVSLYIWFVNFNVLTALKVDDFPYVCVCACLYVCV